MLIMGLPERFWARVVIEDSGYETHCLIWTGSRTGAGYGNLKVGKENAYAHRLTYEARLGPIPKRIDGDRAVIDHLCRNRACVNVDHMEVVTNRTNILRGDTLQAANAAKTRCDKGHEFTPENTRAHGKYGRICKTCERQRKPKPGPRKPRARRTHCKRGHEFTEENTYVKPSGKRECRTCMRDRQRAGRTNNAEPSTDRKKTHCKWGHEFTPENTFYYRNGSRKCRACMRENERRARARKRGQEPQP